MTSLGLADRARAVVPDGTSPVAPRHHLHHQGDMRDVNLSAQGAGVA